MQNATEPPTKKNKKKRSTNVLEQTR